MTAGALQIYEGQDFYVPYYQVKLQGQPVGQEVIHDIIQITYRDSLQAVDSFEITINNWDAQTRSFKYLDDPLFDPGKKVELWIGYYGQEQTPPILTGEITALRPNFPSAGQPTLVITGLNLLHRLRNSQVSYAYENMTDSQVARRIGSRLSINVRTDSTAEANEESYPYLLQENQPDIVFLMERARRIGYDLFVEEDEAGESRLYFGPSSGVKPLPYRLIYGRSLVEFQPNLDNANQVDSVRVQGWDQERRQDIIHTARRSDLRTRPFGPASRQASLSRSFTDRKEVISQRPINSRQEARTLATETLERIAQNWLKASGSTVGLPALRAGSVVMIEELGELFSGRYFVTATTHTIGDSGYTTQFECRREEI